MIRKSWSTGFPVQKLQVTNEFFFQFVLEVAGNLAFPPLVENYFC